MNNDDSQPTQKFANAAKVYANNSHFELSAWDLKIAFAQLDQSDGEGRPDWKAVVTIPWAQAKVLAYYLQINIAIYEQEFGRIAVPQAVLPPRLEQAASDDAAVPQSLKTLANALHDHLFG